MLREKPAPELLGLARAALLSTFVLALVNAGFIATLAWSRPAVGVERWAQHQALDLGQQLAMGLVAWVLVRATCRLPRGRIRPGWLLFVGLALVLGWALLAPDVTNFSNRMGTPTTAPLLRGGIVLAAAAVLAGTAAVGQCLVKTRWRGAGVAGAIAGMILNHLVLPHDYPGVHFFLGWMAATLFATVMARFRMPLGRCHGQSQYLGAAVVALAAWSLLATPPNGVVLCMLAVPGSVTPPFWARLRSEGAARYGVVPRDQKPWFRDRHRLAAIASSTPRVLPGDAVVVLLSIDAVRADLVDRREHDDQLPHLARLRDTSVYFNIARAPGSGTVYTLAAVFSGVYFSQQYWTPHPKQSQLWPHADPGVRFPELLSAAGVPTVTYAGAFWLVNDFGIVRGFSEQAVIKGRSKYAPAAKLADAIIERIKGHGAGPLFLYSHFLDPHAPYNRGGKTGSAVERWRKEVSIVDRQIGRIRAAIAGSDLASRTMLIVTADHGEAFGEHGTKLHGRTLYEEQVRVPLMFHAPGLSPATVDTPVSLIDLGPTVLDLMGQSTPGLFMGESLVPLLRGEGVRLTRPLVGEQRLKRAIVFRDGVKAIVDERHQTTEVYDLRADPGELHNLVGASKLDPGHVDLVRRFFEAHRLRRGGYVVPYRK
ncbi:MAG: sulfatase [Nannocystaceae bacterium]